MDGILNLIESVSEGFPSYSFKTKHLSAQAKSVASDSLTLITTSVFHPFSGFLDEDTPTENYTNQVYMSHL